MTKISTSPRNSQSYTPHYAASSPSTPSPTPTPTPTPSPSPPKTTYFTELDKLVSFRSRIDGVNAFYIRTEEELRLAIGAIRHVGNNTISLDLEGVHLSKDGPISLLHVYDGRAIYIFDVQLLHTKLFKAENGFLQELLSSTTITKVMFDCRKDCEALFYQYGVELDNVIDVQMAEIIYRYRIIGDVPRYFIGLASAVEQYNILKCYDNFELYSTVRSSALDKYSPSRGGRMEIWGDRPINLELLVYCAEDIKNIYRLYTKVFAKKLSYETCIGVSLIRLREILKVNETCTEGAIVFDIIKASSTTTGSRSPTSPLSPPNTPGKCYVNFNVQVFSKFEESLQQYKRMGLV